MTRRLRLEWAFVQRREQSDARIVHPDVDASRRRECLLGEAHDVWFAGDVGYDHMGGSRRRRGIDARSARALTTPGRQHDLTARAGEPGSPPHGRVRWRHRDHPTFPSSFIDTDPVMSGVSAAGTRAGSPYRDRPWRPCRGRRSPVCPVRRYPIGRAPATAAADAAFVLHSNRLARVFARSRPYPIPDPRFGRGLRSGTVAADPWISAPSFPFPSWSRPRARATRKPPPRRSPAKCLSFHTHALSFSVVLLVGKKDPGCMVFARGVPPRIRT
jgi:hypothetical protein